MSAVATATLPETEGKLRVSKTLATSKADDVREYLTRSGIGLLFVSGRRQVERVEVNGLIVSAVVGSATEAEATERAMRDLELSEVQTFVKREGGRPDGRVESYRVIGRVY